MAVVMHEEPEWAEEGLRNLAQSTLHIAIFERTSIMVDSLILVHG